MSQTPPSPAPAPASVQSATRKIPAEPQEGKFRELFDEMIFVFVIVMFMKMFVVELYKIPSGSMTPTLLGGPVAEIDYNKDGRQDLVYWEPSEPQGMMLQNGLVFLNDGERKVLALGEHPTGMQSKLWLDDGTTKGVFDRILVNKFTYWFKHPRRGDVVVFKPPPPAFLPSAPIYIKRTVGEPGEVLTFKPDPATGDVLAQLVANGKPVEKPEFFHLWRYRPSVETNVAYGLADLPYVRYSPMPGGRLHLDEIDVPKDKIYVFGDNTEGSLDSRYWGGVPLENLKGRAFMRVWPPHRFGYIH